MKENNTKIKAEIKISKTEYEKIQKYLNWSEEDNMDDRLDEDDTISFTAKFPDYDGNKIEADVKVCGTQYIKGETNNNAWTEAVLFSNGCEVCCTDPEDELIGEWELEAFGNTYIINVAIDDNK